MLDAHPIVRQLLFEIQQSTSLAANVGRFFSAGRVAATEDPSSTANELTVKGTTDGYTARSQEDPISRRQATGRRLWEQIMSYELRGMIHRARNTEHQSPTVQ